MKISRHKDGSFEMRFTQSAWRFFYRIMSLYPRVPPAHHKATRRGLKPAHADETQALLDEALASHREETRKAVVAILSNPDKAKATDHGHILHLSAGDAMCVLQALNDVRVGSWILLGSPESLEGTALTADQEGDYSIMEVAGFYEHKLIQAINRG